MSIDDVAMGVAVKNSILFALLVLIAHYALRNVLSDRYSFGESSSGSSMIAEDGSESSSAAPGGGKAKTVTFALDRNIEIEPPADRLAPKADPLYDYVFGDSGGGGGTTPSGSGKVAGKAAAASPSSSSSVTTAALSGDHRGCLVVGQYSNENELCGGNLFDTGSLQGHDGVFSNSFSAWA